MTHQRLYVRRRQTRPEEEDGGGVSQGEGTLGIQGLTTAVSWSRPRESTPLTYSLRRRPRSGVS